MRHRVICAYERLEERWRAVRATGRHAAALPALLLSLAVAGCAAGSTAPVGEPVPDPAGTAVELAASTELTDRRQITFGWTLNESGSRVSGRGVLRTAPPDRLRLDLFGPRSETVLAAAMVGDEVRLPRGAATDVAIPSPALLWAGLGAIHPPASSTLQGATAADGNTVLRYATPAGEIYEYVVDTASGAQLRQLQRIGSQGPLETVRLERSSAGEITRASYRDWAAYRDLILDLQESTPAEPFAEEIWRP